MAITFLLSILCVAVALGGIKQRRRPFLFHCFALAMGALAAAGSVGVFINETLAKWTGASR